MAVTFRAGSPAVGYSSVVSGEDLEFRSGPGQKAMWGLLLQAGVGAGRRDAGRTAVMFTGFTSLPSQISCSRALSLLNHDGLGLAISMLYRDSGVP